MYGFLRFSIRIALTAALVLGLLCAAAVIAYRSFFFVHESAVAKQIEPIFGRVTFERFENACTGFAARIALDGQVRAEDIDFNSTRDKLVGAEEFRGKVTDVYKIRPMNGDYLAFRNENLVAISRELGGLDGMSDDLPDYLRFAIDCWQAHDRKYGTETTAEFRSAITQKWSAILLVGTDSPRFLVAMIDKDKAFVFGPSF